MASTGDTMKIAVAIQDLTKEGLKRIEQNLRKIPSSIGIDVKSTMGDVKAIKKLKKDMVEAGAQAGLLNGALDKVGKGTLSGLLADAKRFERNMKVVRESIAKIGKLGNKVDSNRLLSRFSGFDKGTQIAAITSFRDKIASVKAELDKLKRTPRSTKSWDTEKIAKHREQVRALTAEYNRYESVVRRMEGVLSRQATEAKRFHSQQQQSLRTVDSSQARNRGAYQKADFDDFLRRFRIMSSSQRLDEIDAKKRARDRAKTNLNYEQYKLERIDPSNTQAVAQQAQVVALLRAEYKALNSELKKLRATQEKLNKAEKKADTKAQQQRLRAERQEAKRAQQEQKKALQESKQAAAQYRAELNNVQVAMRSTSQIASQMREDIQQAFSYYALKQFLSNLIEIGGQFEYQRRAIANILQDTTKANTLFNQIKELGVKSPFSTLELDSYAKQLSAFDIPYHKMYDTLKKMADIAAGTGADMSRIILAYGHVKAEGFLTGVQRRQFSNANINMVGGLADYYSKLEGQQVTKRDVYRRIHDKQVSFEDMDRVLMSMAEEGGQFYNMQEVMASTVKGTYKNLTDAINHMYMAIEKSANGPLMFFGKTLTSIIKLVESFPGAATRFVVAATAMAGIRALNAKRIQSESAMMVQKIALLDKEKIKLGLLNKKDLIGTSNPFVGQALTKSSAQQLANLMTQTDASTKLLTLEAARTKEAVLAGIAHRTLNKELGAELVKMGAITQQELDRAVASRGVLRIVGRGFGSLFSTIKAGITSLWASIWPMLAIWGVIEAGMWAWNKLMGTEEEERKKAMIDALADSYNSLTREMDGLPESFDNMYTDELFQSIKDMVDIIKNELVDAELILGRVFEKDANGGYLKNTYDQAVALRLELEEAARIKGLLNDKGNISMYSESETDGFKDKYEDYKKAREESNKYLKTNAEYLNYHINSFLVNKPEYQHLVRGLKEGDKIGRVRAILGNRESYQAFYDWADGVDGGKVKKRLREYFKPVLDTYDKASSYATFNRKAWGRTSYNQGVNTAKGQYNVVMTALGAIDMPEEAKQFYAELITKKHFGAIYKGKNDGNVQVPNAIYEAINKELEKLRKLTDPAEQSRFRSFQIQRTGSLADYYDAFKKDYKDLRGKMEEAYKKNAHLEFLDADMLKNPTKITESFKDALKQQAVENWNMDVERYTTLLAAAKIAGYDEADLKEEKKGNKKDQWLEDQQVWFDTLKKAARLYKDNAKVFGTEEAFDIVSNMPEFRDILSGKSKETLAQLARTLEEYLADNSQNFTTDDRKKFRNRVAQEQGELDLTDLKDNITRLINGINKIFEAQLDSFEIYTKLYNATGSYNVASKLAFGENGYKSFDERVLGWQSSNFTERMSNLLLGVKKFGFTNRYDDYVKDAFNSQMVSLGKTFTYDELSGWTEMDWESKGEDIRETFKSAENAIKQWKKTMMDAYANLLSQDKSYTHQLAVIASQLDKDKKAVEASTKDGSEERNRGYSLAEGKASLAKADLKLEGTTFAKNFRAVSKPVFNAIIEELKSLYNHAFTSNAIDVKTYNERMDDINRMESEHKSANRLPLVGLGSQAFILGGFTGYYEHAKSRVEHMKANPEKYDKKQVQEAEDDLEDAKRWKDATDSLKLFTDTLLKGAQNTKNALDLLANMLEAFGHDSMSSSLGGVSGVLGSALGGAQSLSFLGSYGAAAGAIIGGITGIAQAHDKKLNRKIEESRQKVNDLESDYKNMERSMGRDLAHNSGKASENYNNLIAQQAHLANQLAMERDKKDQDPDAIRAIEDQMAETADKIKYYWSDMLKDVYGLDFKDYASRLTEAIVGAFREGKNAAIEWKKTVGDIVRELANELIKQKLVLPWIEDVYEAAFGKNGNGGQLGNRSSITEADIEWIAKKLEAGYEGTIGKAEAIYKALEQIAPYSSDSETVGGLSQIGQTITEETANIVAAYMNTIRADLSVNRANVERLVTITETKLTGLSEIASSQLSQLYLIVENTNRSASSVEAILEKLEDSMSGTRKFHIN